MKLSIIVPVYNVEKYLKECLSSLMKQTLTDFEVLVVNDGCTDNSQDIIDEFVNQYPNKIVSLQKQNGGLSDARNFAIPYVKGEYIAFLDSDDYVSESCYEKLVSKMDEGYDVVVSDIEYFYEEENINSWVMKGLSDGVFESVSKRALLSPMFAWNKIYKADYFTELGNKYPVGTWYEDIPVSAPLFASTEKIGYINEVLFYYRQRSGSIMSAKQDNRVKEIFTVLKTVREKFSEAGFTNKFYDELEYLHIEHCRLYGMFRFMRSSSLESLYDESNACMNEFFPNWKKNRYIERLSLKNKFFLMTNNKLTCKLYQKIIK